MGPAAPITHGGVSGPPALPRSKSSGAGPGAREAAVSAGAQSSSAASAATVFFFLQRMTNYGSGVSEPRSVVTLKAWAPLLLPFPVCSGKSLHPSELIIIPNSQGAKMKRHGLCKEIMFLGPGPIGSALERLPAIVIVIVSV